MLLGAGRSYVGPDASAGNTSDGGAAAPVAATGAEVRREPGHHVAFAVSSSSQQQRDCIGTVPPALRKTQQE